MLSLVELRPSRHSRPPASEFKVDWGVVGGHLGGLNQSGAGRIPVGFIRVEDAVDGIVCVLPNATIARIY